MNRMFMVRHGQVLPQRYFRENMDFPVGDEPITALGREQADLTGKHLADLNFHGVILASPYARTLETAERIASVLGTVFYPAVFLREMFVTDAQMGFCGITGDEILARYPHARLATPLAYPWWEVKNDTKDEIEQRVRTGLAEVIPVIPENADLLLVCHAASGHALCRLYPPVEKRAEYLFNCSVSVLAGSDKTYAHDVSHLPTTHITSNGLTYEKMMHDQMCAVDSILEKIKGVQGTRVLHIGDTHSSLYPIVTAIAKRLSPDVLIHTGDFADEKKCSRIPEHRAVWADTVRPFLDALSACAGRLILIPGNNDIEEGTASVAPFAEILQRNALVTLGGKRFLLCHEVLRMDEKADADVFLYGHGLTKDPRTVGENEWRGRLYYNAVRGYSFHIPEANIHIVLPQLVF